MSAIIVLPCSLWLVLSFIPVYGADYPSAISWAGSSLNKVLLAISLSAIYVHGLMGIQVVLEDYTRDPVRSFSIWAARVLTFFTITSVGYFLGFKI